MLLCSCRGSGDGGRSFSRRSIKHSVYCVLDGRGTRRWQLKGPKLCAAASSEDTTTEVRKGHSRQFRQSCFVSMAMALWRAALVLSVRLCSNEVFSPTVLINESVWSSKMEVDSFLLAPDLKPNPIIMCGPSRHADSKFLMALIYILAGILDPVIHTDGRPCPLC